MSPVLTGMHEVVEAIFSDELFVVVRQEPPPLADLQDDEVDEVDDGHDERQQQKDLE